MVGGTASGPGEAGTAARTSAEAEGARDTGQDAEAAASAWPAAVELPGRLAESDYFHPCQLGPTRAMDRWTPWCG